MEGFLPKAASLLRKVFPMAAKGRVQMAMKVLEATEIKPRGVFQARRPIVAGEGWGAIQIQGQALLPGGANAPPMKPASDGGPERHGLQEGLNHVQECGTVR
jgi:hypothetical protein